MNKILQELNNENLISFRQMHKEQLGHRLSIQIVNFSPNGNYLLTGDWSGAVKLWIVHEENVNFLSTVFFLDEAIEGLNFSQNNLFLGAGTESKLWLHELTSEGELTNVIQILPDEPIRGGIFCFSPNSNLIAVLTYNNDIIIYDFIESEIKGTITDIPSLGGSNSNTITWYDEFIYIGLLNGNIGVYSSKNLTFVKNLEGGHTDSVLAISVMPRGRLASVGADGSIVVWNLVSGSLETRNGKIGRSIFTVDVSNNSDIIVYGTDRDIFAWKNDTNESFSINLGTVTNSTIAISPDGELIVRGTDNNDLTIFSSKTAEILSKIPGRTFSITDSLITNSSDYLICSADDKRIHIFDIETLEEINFLEGHKESVSGIGLSGDDTTLLSIGYDDTIIIWETTSGKILKKIDNVDLPSKVTYFSDGIQNLVVVGCVGDFHIRFYDLNGKLIYNREGHEDYINNLDTYMDKGVFSVADDGKLIFWDNNGKKNILIKSHQKLTAFANNNDRKLFYLGGSNSQIEVWNSNNLSLLARYELNEPIVSIKVDESNNWVLIGCQFTIYLLDSSNIPDNQPIRISDHEEPIKSVLWDKKFKNMFYSITTGMGVYQYEIVPKGQQHLHQKHELENNFENIIDNRIVDQKTMDELSNEKLNLLNDIYSQISIEYQNINIGIKKIASIIQEQVPEDQYSQFDHIISSMRKIKSILAEDLGKIKK